jgi:hypothetical protein
MQGQAFQIRIQLHEVALVIVEGVYPKVLSHDENGITLCTLGLRPIWVKKTLGVLVELCLGKPICLQLLVNAITGLHQSGGVNFLCNNGDVDVWRSADLQAGRRQP